MLLALQESLIQEWCNINSSSNDDSNNPHYVNSSHRAISFKAAELIRARCEAISLPSRLFAREIALAYAANGMENNSVVM
jgi:hypothetical protein